MNNWVAIGLTLPSSRRRLTFPGWGVPLVSLIIKIKVFAKMMATKI